ncbi:protein Hydra magnipapillata [Nesidiocoris tenuis]|uniref:Protein Hydra magnipapillata n=1 Tax=Nesidiocoris tenuis TaxID=355587 RepID=A0ABN7B9M4_9HEMI|nr:protein Hydra magnipapillata [Nesidiocoris tenuis]
MNCCVRKCPSRPGLGLRFFELPSEENSDGNYSYSKAKQRQLWLKAINRDQLPEAPLVCSRHFVSGGPSTLLCTQYSVPSKNLGYDEPTAAKLRPPLAALQPPPHPSSKVAKGTSSDKKRPNYLKAMTESSFDAMMANASDPEMLSNSNGQPSTPKADEPKEGAEAEVAECDVPTTLIMILRCTLEPNLDFIEHCQQVGLIAPSQQCTCGSQMDVVANNAALDGGEWRCLECSARRSIREGTWLEDVRTTSLKEVVIGLYCWSWNYPEHLCKHEMSIRDISFIYFLYKKCQQLTIEYFRNEIGNIGGPGKVVEIEQFQTQSGLHVVGGVERDNMKNVFYRVLPENWTIDDLLTALIDHIAYGSVLHNTNPALSDVMGADASRYLDKIWGLKYDTTSNCESPLVTSLWALFEHLIAEKDYTEESLLEFLMRRRMESARDPFLFLLEVIGTLHPPCIAAS